MTNSERITSHNALIDEAIAKANALPDAGSGGGGVETCTVTMTGGGFSCLACYTAFENGNICGKIIGAGNGFSQNNIVCGSCIVFLNIGILLSWSCSDGEILENLSPTLIYKAPQEAGITANVVVEVD